MSAYDIALKIFKKAEAKAEAIKKAEAQAQATTAEAKAKAKAKAEASKAEAKAKAESQSISALKARIDTLTAEADKKDMLLKQMSDFIEVWTTESKAEAQPESKAEAKPESPARTISDKKALAKESGISFEGNKIILSQYDNVFDLYIQNITKPKDIILINGLPNKDQKHALSLIFAGNFKALKETKNKDYFRKIRNKKDHTETGRMFTCGQVYSGNCGCEARKAKAKAKAEAEAEAQPDLLLGLSESMEAEAQAEADLILLDNAGLSIDDISNDQYMDVISRLEAKALAEAEAEAKAEAEALAMLNSKAEAEAKPLKGIALWNSQYDQSKGSQAEYTLAKKARALLVQNEIKHTGFTKLDYLEVINLAWKADLITLPQ